MASVVDDIEHRTKELAKCRMRLDRGLVTECEASLCVLYECVWLLVDFPDAWPEFSVAAATLPASVLTAAASHLDATRQPDGGWQWPTVGAIGTIYRTANRSESAVVETLAYWLRKWIVMRTRPDAEPGAAPDGCKLCDS